MELWQTLPKYNDDDKYRLVKVKYSKEQLVHYNCDCGGWWAIGDGARPRFCTHCGGKIESFELAEPLDNLQPKNSD